MKSTQLTLVLGASENPDRYAYKAISRLVEHGIPVLAVGRKAGIVAGVPITTEIPAGAKPDTVTLYLNPANQAIWMDKILALKPRRILFNPGTENPDFVRKARQAGIQTEEACTLVLLSTGAF